MLYIKLVRMYVIAMFTAIFIYPLLHELGHYLAALLVGADVVEMSIFPMPYVSMFVDPYDSLGQAVIGMCGMIFPMIYFLLAFAVGAAVGYLFYGGLAKNEFGDPTTMTWILNVVISSIVGLVAGVLYLPIRTKQIMKKKQNDLKLQFRELLDALATSIGSGKNVVDSFKAARDDLRVIYSEETAIIKELDVILDGINNDSMLNFKCL